MGLIGWWPLNDNLEDYSGYRNHGVAIGTLDKSNEGKIGKTYNFTNSNNGVSINKNFAGMSKFTMSAWVNPKGSHQNYNGAIISSGNWNATCWSFGLNQHNTAIDVAGSHYNKNIPYNIPLNKWTHILCVVDGLKSSLYVNGVYVSDYTLRNGMIGSDASNMCIGRETYAGGHFSFNGSINDVRIYDHCCSLKEIKEIYQTKILHYKFNAAFEEPTTNIFPGKDHMTASGVVATWDGNKVSWTSAGGISGIYFGAIPIKQNTSYTVSFKFRKVSGLLRSIRGHSESQFRTITYIDGVNKGSFKDGIALEDTFKVFDFKIIYNNTTATNFNYNWIQANFTLDTPVTVEVWDIQIEEGTNQTPYINNSASRNLLIGDSSGHRNHGIVDVTTSPDWIEDEGWPCAKFTGREFINCNSKVLPTEGKQCWTVAAWIKYDEAPTGMQTLINMNLGFNSNYNDKALLYVNSGSEDWYRYSRQGSTKINEWYHLTGTFDEASKTIKVYINGKDVTIPGPDGNVPRGILNNLKLFENFNGKCHDIRIYATVLSDADILELYNTRASVDKNGLMFINEIVEGNAYSKNLVKNGYGEYEDNTNFLPLVFDGNGFSATGYYGFTTNELIPVSQFDEYRYKMTIKKLGTIDSKYYAGLSCFDKNKVEINHWMVNNVTNSRTTLARPLRNGDRIVYLTSSSGWIEGTPETSAHNKIFGAFTDNSYEDYRFATVYREYLTVDTVNNTIKLDNAWTGGDLPAGTKVANCYHGGTYVYLDNGVLSSTKDLNIVIPKLWANPGDNSKFRYGTYYVKIMCLMNHTQNTEAKMSISNVSLENITSGQQLENGNIITKVNNKGILECNRIIEVNTSGFKTKTEFGANWVRLFYHNNKAGTVLFSTKDEFLKCDDIDKKSDLWALEMFRGEDQKFELLLQYASGGTGYNRWKQASNFTRQSILGYEPISISWTNANWGGLAPSSNSSTFVDGSPNADTWYYAIGAKSSFSGGIPNWNSAETEWVEVWVRCEDQNLFKMYKDGTVKASEFIEN